MAKIKLDGFISALLVVGFHRANPNYERDAKVDDLGRLVQLPDAMKEMLGERVPLVLLRKSVEWTRAELVILRALVGERQRNVQVYTRAAASAAAARKKREKGEDNTEMSKMARLMSGKSTHEREPSKEEMLEMEKEEGAEKSEEMIALEKMQASLDQTKRKAKRTQDALRTQERELSRLEAKVEEQRKARVQQEALEAAKARAPPRRKRR